MQNTNFAAFFKDLPLNSLWILDIDSTLVLTHKRNEAILHRFAEEFRATYPEFCDKLSQTTCNALEYGYGKALERPGIDQNQEACTELAKYWRRHFFSNNFLHYDMVFDEALKFVETLQTKNKPFVYLTGRPHPLMFDGTLRVLRQFGFDVDETRLFLKPMPEDQDELFKSQKIAELKKKNKKFIFLDNEPKVLNQIAKDHPEIPLIFMDTCHSPNVTPPSKALHLKQFSDLIPYL